MNMNEGITEVPQTVQVASFGRRFVAYFLDGIILNILGCGLGLGCNFLAVSAAEYGQDTATMLNLASNCLGLLVGALYFIVFWATTGQTLGKMALGIKVISTDGSPVSWGQAIGRYFGYIISGLVLGIGFIWAAFDSKRQGWHDKIAKTYVVPKDTQFSSEAVIIAPSDTGSSVALVGLFVIIFILIPIVVIAILLLLGPVVGNVFSNIVENLGTPTP